MEIYSEYHEGDRKATITRLRRNWDPRMDAWEVALYVRDRVIQRATLTSEQSAENLAEDFVRGEVGSGPTLLNEDISNG